MAGEQPSAGAWRGRLHDEPGRALAEQRDRGRVPDREPHLGADPAPERLLRERDREAAARHVLAASTRPRAIASRMHAWTALAVEVERRRAVLGRRAREPLVLRAGEPGAGLAEEQDRVAAARNAGPTSVATSSSRPTMPISGVGAIAEPGASLYSETLPPVTGSPSAGTRRTARGRPRRAARRPPAGSGRRS